MNKAELIRRSAQKLGVQRAEAERAVEATLQTIAEGLYADDQVVISNFGVFEVTNTKGRSYTMPSGEVVAKASRRKIKFRPSPNLGAYVDGEKVAIAHGNR